MNCPGCQHKNRSAAKFCEKCAAPLKSVCASCGSELRATAKFCGECGTSVSEPAASHAPTHAAPGPTPSGEHRQLTVVFCDLVNSTQLSQQVDAEEWRYIIAQYQQAISSAVARFGGHVAKDLGDGLLIYFGWPVAHEDDPERAVRAGLAAIDAMGSLNAALATGDANRLSVRIGMHTGPVVVADDGAIFGDTTNVAARVQAAADPDTVMITAATHRLVAGMFVINDRGPQVLKGLRDPVTLYRVVQASGVRSRLDIAAGRLSKFVGRDVEMATLVDRWERVQDGEGQNVVVLGEAGIGKSRLVYQLREHLAAVPHTWLECGATPYTEGTPFHPIIALVTQGLRIGPEDSATEQLGKIGRGLRTLASAETIALLAEFLGVPPPARLQMSPELQRHKTIDLLVQWNLSLSAAQPLVMVVEDLHWCDASTLEVLGQVMAQSATARVLVLATARPEFSPPWPARSNLTTLQLERLTKRQTRAMVETLVGTELPPAMVDAVVARTDGVPLYVEELAKAIAERETCGMEAIPATLADSLMERLDRLSAAKEIAQHAAVLGRECDYPLLQATSGLDETALRHGLARLVDAEILFARGEPPTAAYTFKHALIQETAYRSLLKRTRQQFHARIAEVLEGRFPERVASEPEVAARHYDEAGLAAAAIAHYRRAGERATQRTANEEAIRHLRRALELAASLPESPERDQMELALLVAIGPPLMAAGRGVREETEQIFARARELAARIDSPELPRVLVKVGGAYVTRGELPKALETAHEAIAAAERYGNTYECLAAHVNAGIALFFQGNFSSALQHLETSIRMYDVNKHATLAYTAGTDYGVYARCYASWCHAYLGRPDRALALSQEAFVLGEAVGHPLSLAYAITFGGVVHFRRGEIDEARRCAEEAIVFTQRVGFPLLLGVARVLRGWAAAESGDGEAGVADMQQAIVELSGIGSGVGAPQILFQLSEVLRKIGRRDEALAMLALAEARADQQGQHYYDAELHRLRAEILLDSGGDRIEEAEKLFEKSLEIARRQEAKTFELRAATSLARTWQHQGRGDAARALLAPVYAWFTEGFDTRDLKEAEALLDEIS